jgi:hypothetical protein
MRLFLKREERQQCDGMRENNLESNSGSPYRSKGRGWVEWKTRKELRVMGEEEGMAEDTILFFHHTSLQKFPES